MNETSILTDNFVRDKSMLHDKRKEGMDDGALEQKGPKVSMESLLRTSIGD